MIFLACIWIILEDVSEAKQSPDMEQNLIMVWCFPHLSLNIAKAKRLLDYMLYQICVTGGGQIGMPMEVRRRLIFTKGR